MYRLHIIEILFSVLTVFSWSCAGTNSSSPKDSETGADTSSEQSSDIGTDGSDPIDDQDSDTNIDTDTGSDADTDTDTDVDTDTDTDMDTDTDVDTDTDTDTDVDSDTDTDTDVDTDSDTDTDIDADSDTDTDIDSDTDTDTDSDTDTDTDVDTDSDTDTDSDLDTDSDTDSDTEPQMETESTGDSETETESDSQPIVLDTDYETDPSAVTLKGPCPLERYIGGFKVEMNAEAGYTAIDGSVQNSVDPGLVPEVALSDGDCRLLKRRTFFCDPSCQSGETCTPEETCIDMPLGQDVGIAVFQGLVKTVVVEPIQPGNTYFYTKLNHPGFVSGNVINLTTTGGYIDALELFGVGVEPLSPPENLWVLEEGTPLTIEWAAPPEGVRSTMRVSINIDQHGATPETLVCDLPDTGSATIPSSVIDEFIQNGVTGFPSATAVRRTVDSFDGDLGCVEFQVTSVSTADVEVTGYIPCTSDDNCPSPLHCNKEIEQCQ
jgi:hypothetical protein